jgi:iron complex transport system permease protein
VKGAFWAAALVALVGLATAGVALGAVPLDVSDVWAALMGRGDPVAVAIVRTLRLPRVALAALVGAGLGMSGAALQGVLRNGLAEPYLLGVSGGAAVGAVITLIFRTGPSGRRPIGPLVSATGKGAKWAALAGLEGARWAGERAAPGAKWMAEHGRDGARWAGEKSARG